MLYGLFPGRMTIQGAASQGAASQGGGQHGTHADECDLVVLEDMSAQGVEELRGMRHRALPRSALVFATFPQADAWRALNLSSPQVSASLRRAEHASAERACGARACVEVLCRGDDTRCAVGVITRGAHHVQAAAWGTAVHEGLLRPLACFSPSARLLPTPRAAGAVAAGGGGSERQVGKVSAAGHGGAGGGQSGIPPVGVLKWHACMHVSGLVSASYRWPLLCVLVRGRLTCAPLCRRTRRCASAPSYSPGRRRMGDQLRSSINPTH